MKKSLKDEFEIKNDNNLQRLLFLEIYMIICKI